VKREFGPTLATWDEQEEERLDHIEEYVSRHQHKIHIMD
jgi:hypothetical protein